MVLNSISKFVLFCIILQTRCHDEDDNNLFKQEPFKVEVKGGDLIRPETSTVGPGTTTNWEGVEMSTNTFSSTKHRSTFEPVIKMKPTEVILIEPTTYTLRPKVKKKIKHKVRVLSNAYSTSSPPPMLNIVDNKDPESTRIGLPEIEEIFKSDASPGQNLNEFPNFPSQDDGDLNAWKKETTPAEDESTTISSVTSSSVLVVMNTRPVKKRTSLSTTLGTTLLPETSTTPPTVTSNAIPSVLSRTRRPAVTITTTEPTGWSTTTQIPTTVTQEVKTGRTRRPPVTITTTADPTTMIQEDLNFTEVTSTTTSEMDGNLAESDHKLSENLFGKTIIPTDMKETTYVGANPQTVTGTTPLSPLDDFPVTTRRPSGQIYTTLKPEIVRDDELEFISSHSTVKIHTTYEPWTQDHDSEGPDTTHNFVKLKEVVTVSTLTPTLPMDVTANTSPEPTTPMTPIDTDLNEITNSTNLNIDPYTENLNLIDLEGPTSFESQPIKPDLQKNVHDPIKIKEKLQLQNQEFNYNNNLVNLNNNTYEYYDDDEEEYEDIYYEESQSTLGKSDLEIENRELQKETTTQKLKVIEDFPDQEEFLGNYWDRPDRDAHPAPVTFPDLLEVRDKLVQKLYEKAPKDQIHATLDDATVTKSTQEKPNTLNGNDVERVSPEMVEIVKIQDDPLEPHSQRIQINSVNQSISIVRQENPDNLPQNETTSPTPATSTTLRKFTYALRASPTPSIIPETISWRWHQLGKYENEVRAMEVSQGTSPTPPAFPTTPLSSYTFGDDDDIKSVVKSLPKTTKTFPIFSPTTPTPLFGEFQGHDGKPIVKSLPYLSNILTSPVSILPGHYEYPRYGSPIYGYRVQPYPLKGPDIHPPQGQSQFLQLVHDPAHLATIRQQHPSQNQLTLDDLYQEGNLAASGLIPENTRIEKSVSPNEHSLSGIANQVDGVIGNDRFHITKKTSVTTPTTPSTLEMNDSETQDLPKYTFKILTSPPLHEMTVAESQKHHSNNTLHYKYNLLSPEDADRYPRPEKQDIDLKKYTFRLIDNTTPMPEISTESSRKKYTYGLLTSRKPSDHEESESTSRYTYSIVPSTQRPIEKSDDEEKILEEAPSIREETFEDWSDKTREKVIIDSNNKVKRVKIRARARGTTTPTPKLDLEALKGSNAGFMDVMNPFVDHEPEFSFGLAPKTTTPSPKEVLSPDDEWETVATPPPATSVEFGKVPPPPGAIPIAEYQGKELQRLSYHGNPSHDQHHFSSLVHTARPQENSFTPKHNALSGKVQQTAVYPTAIKTLAPRIDLYGSPPTPQAVPLPGLRPFHKTFEPPFQVTQPFMSNQHLESLKIQPDPTLQGLTEDPEEMKAIKSMVRSTLPLESLTFNQVKERIDSNKVFQQIDPRVEQKPQPRRPEPSQRPAFGPDNIATSNGSPLNHFSVVTPNSYINVFLNPTGRPVQPAEPVTPFQTSFEVNHQPVTVQSIDTKNEHLGQTEAVEPFEDNFLSSVKSFMAETEKKLEALSEPKRPPMFGSMVTVSPHEDTFERDILKIPQRSTTPSTTIPTTTFQVTEFSTLPPVEVITIQNTISPTFFPDTNPVQDVHNEIDESHTTAIIPEVVARTKRPKMSMAKFEGLLDTLSSPVFDPTTQPVTLANGPSQKRVTNRGNTRLPLRLSNPFLRTSSSSSTTKLLPKLTKITRRPSLMETLPVFSLGKLISSKSSTKFTFSPTSSTRQTPPTTTSPSAPLHVSPYFEQHGLEPEHRPLSGFILPLVSTKKFTTPTATPGVQQREDKNVNVHPPTFAPPSTFALPQFDTQSESNRGPPAAPETPPPIITLSPIQSWSAEREDPTTLSPKPTTMEVLLNNNLTIMAKILEETGLQQMLNQNSYGSFTVFAPTDQAFHDFFKTRGGVEAGIRKLKQNQNELQKVAENHIVNGRIFASSLDDDFVGQTISNSKLRANLYLTEDHEWKEFHILTINGAVLSTRDLSSDNGLVHVVNHVLYPPASGDLIETLKSDPENRFTTFVKALKATKLDRDLKDYATGPWTIFAPTNEAFMNLPMRYLENMIKDTGKLSKLILNHIVNQTIYSAGLRSHQEVRMANGRKLNLYARPDRLKIEGSNILTMDISATNGVIQVLENVIELDETKLNEEYENNRIN